MTASLLCRCADQRYVPENARHPFHGVSVCFPALYTRFTKHLFVKLLCTYFRPGKPFCAEKITFFRLIFCICLSDFPLSSLIGFYTGFYTAWFRILHAAGTMVMYPTEESTSKGECA